MSTYKISQKDEWSEAGEPWRSQTLEEMDSFEKVALVREALAKLEWQDQEAYQRFMSELTYTF